MCEGKLGCQDQLSALNCAFCIFFVCFSTQVILYLERNVAVVQIQTDVHCLDVCIVDLSAVQMRESVFIFFIFFFINATISSHVSTHV